MNKKNSANELTTYIERHTSGSTGNPKTVIWEKNEYYLSMLFTWRQRKQYGIIPLDKYVTFHSFYYINGTPIEIDEIKNRNIYSISKLKITHERLSEIVLKIKTFEPKWIQIQPSIAYMIGNYIKSNNIKFDTLKYIELTGEYCEKELFANIKNIFLDTVICNQYGTEEVNTIGYCENGDNIYNIFEDNVCVEIDTNGLIHKEFGISGKILVSSLIKKKYPSIRIDTGDFGYLEMKNGVVCLHLQTGRNNDAFVYNGEKYDSSIFYFLTEFLNSIGAKIYYFHYILQNNELYCYYMKSSDIKSEDIGDIAYYFLNTRMNINIGKSKLHIIILDKIDIAKTKYFENRDIYNNADIEL